MECALLFDRLSQPMAAHLCQDSQGKFRKAKTVFGASHAKPTYEVLLAQRPPKACAFDGFHCRGVERVTKSGLVFVRKDLAQIFIAGDVGHELDEPSAFSDEYDVGTVRLTVRPAADIAQGRGQLLDLRWLKGFAGPSPQPFDACISSSEVSAAPSGGNVWNKPIELLLHLLLGQILERLISRTEYPS
jgi:hypothetical protein